MPGLVLLPYNIFLIVEGAIPDSIASLFIVIPFLPHRNNASENIKAYAVEVETVKNESYASAYMILIMRSMRIENLKTKIQDILNMEQTVKKRKKEIKESIDMDNNELALVIVMNAPFGKYGEIFDDDGNVTLAHNGDYKTINV